MEVWAVFPGLRASWSADDDDDDDDDDGDGDGDGDGCTLGCHEVKLLRFVPKWQKHLGSS